MKKSESFKMRELRCTDFSALLHIFWYKYFKERVISAFIEGKKCDSLFELSLCEVYIIIPL